MGNRDAASVVTKLERLLDIQLDNIPKQIGIYNPERRLEFLTRSEYTFLFFKNKIKEQFGKGKSVVEIIFDSTLDILGFDKDLFQYKTEDYFLVNLENLSPGNLQDIDKIMNFSGLKLYT